MSERSTIDFSAYTDAGLQEALGSINKNKFPANYQVCRAEIEKRRAEGRWSRREVERKKRWTMRERVRVLAMLQTVGAALGIGRYAVGYLFQVLHGSFSILETFFTLFAIAMFAVTGWAAWRYVKTRRDEGGLWQTMLYLQIPVFAVFGLNYEFYSGFHLLLGFLGGGFSFAADVGSSLTFAYLYSDTHWVLMINVAALVVLGMLAEANKATSDSEGAPPPPS